MKRVPGMKPGTTASQNRVVTGINNVLISYRTRISRQMLPAIIMRVFFA